MIEHMYYGAIWGFYKQKKGLRLVKRLKIALKMDEMAIFNICQFWVTLTAPGQSPR